MSSSIINCAVAHLGFHSETSVEDFIIYSDTIGCVSLRVRNTFAFYQATNFWTAVNLIPIVGNLVAGIYHIHIGKEIQDKAFVIRGIIELTIIGGILLAVLDIIVSIGRLIQQALEAYA